MQMPLARRLAASITGVALMFAVLAGIGVAQAGQDPPLITSLHALSTLSSAVPTGGPAAGDQNPYGVAVVKRSSGELSRGDVLVSNFNNGRTSRGQARASSRYRRAAPSAYSRWCRDRPRRTRSD